MGRYQEKITYSRLREVLDYNEHTGVFKWKVPSGNRCKIGVELKPSASTKYLLITIDGRTYRAHRLAWLYVHKTLPDYLIDHIDGNTHNNAISNLRQADRITNGYNSKLRKDSKTGIKGVTWDSRRGKYRVTIVVNKVQIHLGRYSDIELATLVSEEARAKLHKEFCRYE
ncbi:homing endonuclease [Providencia phage PSTRCR_114]|uniref:Homing endonuclease n=1 Tax=Providencia phage PSTRCR_114 TaxID=2800824 RepID=A0A7T7CL35_9CAUD|nr:homing endonuclease [Providencia phage PSTRCR_114]